MQPASMVRAMSDETATKYIPVHGILLRVSAAPPSDPNALRHEFNIRQRIQRSWQARQGHKVLRMILGDDEISDPTKGAYSRRFVADLVYDVLLNMRRDGLVPMSLLGPLLSTRADDATKLESGRVVERVIVVDVAGIARGLAGHYAKRVEP